MTASVAWRLVGAWVVFLILLGVVLEILVSLLTTNALSWPGIIVLLGLLLSGAAMIYKYSKPKWRCPSCFVDLPRWRAPNNLKQAFWGGCTCPGCHREIELYFSGRPKTAK